MLIVIFYIPQWQFSRLSCGGASNVVGTCCARA